MKSRRPSRLERPGSNGRSSRQKTALVDNKTRHDSAAENGTPEFHAHTRFTPETGGAPQCDAHPRPGHRHPHGHSNVAEPRWDPKASVGSEAKECLQQETLRTATAVGSQMELNQESQKLRALGTSEMHPKKSEFAEQWEKDRKESTTVIRFERSRRVGTSCRRGTCGLGRKDRRLVQRRSCPMELDGAGAIPLLMFLCLVTRVLSPGCWSRVTCEWCAGSWWSREHKQNTNHIQSCNLMLNEFLSLCVCVCMCVCAEYVFQTASTR
jgi:hypothetical protein